MVDEKREKRENSQVFDEYSTENLAMEQKYREDYSLWNEHHHLKTFFLLHIPLFLPSLLYLASSRIDLVGRRENTHLPIYEKAAAERERESSIRGKEKREEEREGEGVR